MRKSRYTEQQIALRAAHLAKKDYDTGLSPHEPAPSFRSLDLSRHLIAIG